jgi:hypothetical protein
MHWPATLQNCGGVQAGTHPMALPPFAPKPPPVPAPPAPAPLPPTAVVVVELSSLLQAPNATSAPTSIVPNVHFQLMDAV